MFSIMVLHRILNIVACATQYDLVVYPFYIYQVAFANLKLPFYPLPLPSPLANTNLLSISLI